jgi:hypothetical protein
MSKLCLRCHKEPIAPPSRVICKSCQDRITRFLEDEIKRLEGKK